MLPNAMLWEELKSSDIPEAIEKSKGVCVIPLGAMEKHGPHMPLGTDNIIAERTAILAAEKEPVVIMPTLDFGYVNGLQYTPGAICFSIKLLFRFFDELCSEIARNGFKKILIHNAHGGNFPLLGTFANMMREKKRDYVVAYVHSFMKLEDEFKYIIANRGEFPELNDEDYNIIKRYIDEKIIDGHAGFEEMNMVYESRPETIYLDKIGDEDGMSIHRTDHLTAAGLDFGNMTWHADYPNSYAAQYFPYCNERLAKAYMRARVKSCAHTFKVMKEDTEFMKVNEEWNNMW